LKTATLLALVVGVSAIGCSDERLSPVPVSSTVPSSGGAGVGGSGGEGGAPPEVPRVREVFIRSPLGSPIDNLFADGDFELSIVPEDRTGGQFGWIALRMSGAPETILGETGGLCRSGLRCGRLEANRILFGRGTSSATGSAHSMSIWVKPLQPRAEGPCELGSFYAIACETFDVLRSLKETELPDENGWCQLSASVPEANGAICLYGELAADALVDNATLLAEERPEPLPQPLPVALPAERAERMVQIREILRAKTPFTKGPVQSEESPRRRE
jgi:hypothetical protein